MINLTCSKCSQSISVPDHYEGKRIKCRKCETVITVPSIQVATILPDEAEQPTKQCPFCGETVLAVAKKCKHCGEALKTPVAPNKNSSTLGTTVKNLKGNLLSDTRRKALTKIMPLWIWYAVLGWMVMMVFGTILYLGFRDTWEKDNYDKIKNLSDQALRLSLSKQYNECFRTYEELFKLVEPHHLTYTKTLIDQSRASYQQAKVDFTQYQSQLEAKQKQEELTLCSQLQYELTRVTQAFQAAKYKDAMDQCQMILKRAEGREIKTSELKSLLESVRTQQQMIEKQLKRIEWAMTEKTEIIKGYVFWQADRYIPRDHSLSEELSNITITDVREIQHGLCKVKGNCVSERYGYSVKKDTENGEDTDTVNATRNKLEAEGYEYKPDTDAVENVAGRTYQKKIKVKKDIQFAFDVRCSYRDQRIWLRTDKMDVDGKALVIDKATSDKDDHLAAVEWMLTRTVVEPNDDPKTWTHFEKLINLFFNGIKNGSTASFKPNVWERSVGSYDEAYKTLVSPDVKVTGWGILELANEVEFLKTITSQEKTTFMRAIVYVEKTTGDSLSVSVNEIRFIYDKEKDRWLWNWSR